MFLVLSDELEHFQKYVLPLQKIYLSHKNGLEINLEK